ncbi:hypothetical protein BDV23DRAFT_184838 [Aspergillus alliaceus]|uniref:PLC-like phosphodiesterase n=1 Tax=Petromyces alliaceus TaxID=209559 RepID=A0A5N7C5K3_PETAA|nr:hypothetical protein BDV23DRAFT_184838 [Aspergillus alliaceus]
MATKGAPLWAVAHRVSYIKSLDIALSNGANAIEMDMCPYEEGWFVNHDCSSPSASPEGKQSAADMFRAIGQRRNASDTMGFVFLDLKNPRCSSSPACRLSTLQNLARKYLELYGVRVLYAFTDPDNSVAFRSIGESLTTDEAVSVIRPFAGAEKILKNFEGQGKLIPTAKRVMDKGVSIFSQMKKGACIRDQQHDFARVFTWTTTTETGNLANMLLEKSGVHGLLYGHGMKEYDASACSAALDVINWVERNSDHYYMATNSDRQW